ncbi:response regulator [Corynebacterium striatum]|nr:response regulator transcription factor [Corynebacterium striatum]
MSEHDMEKRVLIVDDDPLVLHSFRQYFATTEDIRVVAEAHNGIEALTAIDSVNVDIVLADIHMPEMDGVTLLQEVQRRLSPPVFVAITALDSDETMLKVLAGGGAGYIIKSSRPQAIITAVREAMTGGTTVSPQALNRLIKYIPGKVLTPAFPQTNLSPVYERLTKAETHVLQYICQGLSNAEIASAMKYSEATVKKHVSHLIACFGVTSRLSLAITVIQSGLGKSL